MVENKDGDHAIIAMAGDVATTTTTTSPTGLVYRTGNGSSTNNINNDTNDYADKDEDDYESNQHHHSLPPALYDSFHPKHRRGWRLFPQPFDVRSGILWATTVVVSIGCTVNLISVVPWTPRVGSYHHRGASIGSGGGGGGGGGGIDFGYIGGGFSYSLPIDEAPELTVHSPNADMSIVKHFRKDFEKGRIDRNEYDLPNLVWLVSYPDSGAEALLEGLHRFTGRSTATNSAIAAAWFQQQKSSSSSTSNDPIKESESVRLYGVAGPALLAPELPLPERHALVWHAAPAPCRNCHPHKYFKNYRNFSDGLWKGTVWGRHGIEEAVRFDPDLAKASVHLTRNPFDVVVRRYWDLLKLQTQTPVVIADAPDSSSSTGTPTSTTTTTTTTRASREAFQRYCAEMDQVWEAVESVWYGPALMHAAEGVICRQEFYRYAAHLADSIRLRDDFHLPTLRLRYEDSPERNVEALTAFLELPLVVDPAAVTSILNNINGDHKPYRFRDYYTSDMVRRTFDFMKAVAATEGPPQGGRTKELDPRVIRVLEEYQTELVEVMYT